MGNTLVKIGKECKVGVDALTSSLVKRKMSYFSLPSAAGLEKRYSCRAN